MYQDPNEDWPTLKQWVANAIDGRWSAAEAMNGTDSENDYLVQGMLPRKGTSVWFGAGSTGKTQLLLWMAAAIAADRKLVPDWLGHPIKGGGHVLVLSAEDTGEQLFMRLRGIAKEALGLDESAARTTCSRIHIMPFISMTEDEFDQPNAGLFSFEKGWSPNNTMDAIRAFIEGWNAIAEKQDRIVGVIMDSATSMAGFEATVSEAVTNFFFYLNRLCEALDLFWVIIGHTPKSQKINPDDPDADAAARLRGVALWTTAPRTTVEVRQALGPRSQPKSRFGKGSKLRQNFEAKPVLDAGFAEKPTDVVIVRVAKSNYYDAYRDKHFLVRHPAGMFEDVTARLPTQPDNLESPNVESVNGLASITETQKQEAGTAAVWDLIVTLTSGGAPGSKISASLISGALKTWRDKIDGLEHVLCAGTDKEGNPRIGAANWHLTRLHDQGRLVRSGKAYAIADEVVIAPSSAQASSEIA